MFIKYNFFLKLYKLLKTKRGQSLCLDKVLPFVFLFSWLLIMVLKVITEIFALFFKGIEEVTSDETASRIPPRDFLNADNMYYDTDIGYDSG